MLRVILMALLAAAMTFQIGCTSRSVPPAGAPRAAAAPASAPAPGTPADSERCEAFSEPAEPTPTLAPPLPDDPSQPGAQTVYVQIAPDSRELEVELLGP